MSAYAAHGLLSYYDLELVKGAYGNLILFAKPDGPARWGRIPSTGRPSRSRLATTTRSGSTRARCPAESSRTASSA